MLHEHPAEPDLVVPDRFLDAGDRRAAEAVLAEVPGAVQLAWIGGSLTAGLGHGLSDIDIHLVMAPGETLPGRLSHRRDGRMVQLNPMDVSRAERIVDALSGYRVSPSDRTQVEVGERELADLVRLAIGTVMVSTGALPVPDTAARRETARRIVLTRSATFQSGLAEDVQGAGKSGDLLTALSASRLALEEALEGLLAAADDLYAGRKFLLRRAARTPAVRAVLPLVWELFRDPDWPPDPTSVRRLVRRRLSVAGHLLAVAQLDGWERPVETVWEPGEGPGVARSPWITAIRYGDSWSFAGPDRGFRTTEGMVRLWAELDGSPRDEFLTRLRRRAPAFADLPDGRIDEAVERLVGASAAVPGGGSDEV